MRIQKQPNRWTCLPTSFAIVMDIPLATLLKRIGHDGSEIIYPELPEPLQRRSFHIQECTAAAYGLGWASTTFSTWDFMAVDDEHQRRVDLPFDPDKLLCRCGVAMGDWAHNRHAVAFDSWRFYDPNGTEYDFNIKLHQLDAIVLMDLI